MTGERVGSANPRFELGSDDTEMQECESCEGICSDYHDTCPICDGELSPSDTDR